MSATAALIEPMTNPWISQQSQQSQWWFGLITVCFTLMYLTWVFPKISRDVPLGKRRG